LASILASCFVLSHLQVKDGHHRGRLLNIGRSKNYSKIFSKATQLFMYGDGQVRIRVEQRSQLSTTVVHSLTQ